MKNLRIIAVYLSLLVVGINCNKDHLLDGFKSAGSETTVTRLLPPFTAVRAGGKFDVVLIQDSSVQEQVQITAGEHIIDGITTEVEDGKLVIKNSNKCNWVRKLKVRFKVVITLKSINKLEIEGAAKFTTGNTLKVPVLDIQHNGIEDAKLDIKINNFTLDGKKAGGFILSGSAVIFSCSMEDQSRIEGRNLYTSDFYISNYSVNDSYIYAERRMAIKVYGEGNVYYLDQPLDFFEKQEFGRGRAIRQ